MKVIIFIIFMFTSHVLANSLEQNLENANKYTVKIFNSIDIPFIEDTRGSGNGTGILIDKERGYILSNAHVTGSSPAKNEVNFKEQDKSFEDLGKDLRKKINAEILMVTRSEEGVTLFTDKNVQTISTKARKVHDVSGAGDTAISAFVLADLCGANIEESAMISNYAAGRVCEEVGVVPISLEMIKDIVDHYSN